MPLDLASVMTCSYLEFHPIICDFESGVPYGAIRGARFVQHGIRVVDVDQNATKLIQGWYLPVGRRKLVEQTVGAGKWKMTDFAGGFSAAADVDEFVVSPESAVEQREVAADRRLFPSVGLAGDARREQEMSFGVLAEFEADHGFLRREGFSQRRADIVGVIAAERNRFAGEVADPDLVIE